MPDDRLCDIAGCENPRLDGAVVLGRAWVPDGMGLDELVEVELRVCAEHRQMVLSPLMGLSYDGGEDAADSC